MPAIPDRSAGLPRSGIRAIMDAAWAAQDPVIRLEVGQPDTAPPDHVLQAMADAIARHDTGYTPNAGIPELRAACAEKLRRVNGAARTPEQVLVVAGSMQGLSSVLLAIAEPGGEVLIPDPGWPNYAMACRLVGITAVPYPLVPEDGYRPDLEAMGRLMGPRTLAVVVNSPSNPLGTVLGEADLAGIHRLCRDHGAWLLSDECYDEIVHDGRAPSPAALDGAEDVVAVHSFSKTYAMTGLRVGYVSGPTSIIRTLTTMQEALIACVNGPAQRAAVAALEGPQDFVADRAAVYRRRRDRAVAEAADVGLPHLTPSGAFYLWLPVGDVVGDDGVRFCTELVGSHGVAVAPGDTFGPGGRGAVRVSLAASEDDIVEGLRRLAAAVL